MVKLDEFQQGKLSRKREGGSELMFHHIYEKKKCFCFSSCVGGGFFPKLQLVCHSQTNTVFFCSPFQIKAAEHNGP
jgi:hypothetical protein